MAMGHVLPGPQGHGSERKQEQKERSKRERERKFFVSGLKLSSYPMNRSGFLTLAGTPSSANDLCS